MARRAKVWIEADADDLAREAARSERALKGIGPAGARAGAQASAGMDRASRSARALRVAGGAAASTISRTGAAARTASPYIAGGLALGIGKSVIEYREAYKVGEQTNAVIESTGGAAKVTAKEVANLAQVTSQKSGIDDEAIQSMQNMLLTFKEIRNEQGQNNDVFDQTTQVVTDMSVAMDKDLRSTAIMAGKALNDPILGLTSLGRAGVQFTEDQKKQIEQLVKNNDLLGAQRIILKELTSQFGGSAEAQADSFDKLQVTGENLAEALGTKITPKLAEFADELSDTLNDKNLTGDQKFDHIANMLEDGLIEGIDVIEDHAGDIASAGGRIGLRMAGGLVQGFTESDLLGKLFIGSSVIRMVGGPGALAKAGMGIGGYIAGGVATGVASGRVAGVAGAAGSTGATGGILGALSKAGGVAGRLGAVGLGLTLGGEILDGISSEMQEGSDDLFEALEAIGDDTIFEKVSRLPHTVVDPFGEDELDTPEWAESAKDLAAHLEEIRDSERKISGDEVDDLRRAIAGIPGVSDEAKEQFEELVAAVEESPLEKATHGARVAMQDFRYDWSQNLRDMTGISERELDKIQTLLSEKPKKGIEAMRAALRRGVQGIRGAMDDGEVSTREGMTAIHDLLNKQLQAYGMSQGDAEKILKAKQDPQNATGLQQGGVLGVPGSGTGDTVPALLPDGWFVLNSVASGEMGFQAGGLNRVMLEPKETLWPPEMADVASMANSMWPRFQKGGKPKSSGLASMVARVNQFESQSFPYSWGGGHGNFGLQPVDCSGFVSDVLHTAGLLSTPMVSGALASWGKPASGSEPLVVYANPTHTLMSLNGRYAGTSASNPGGGAGWIESSLSSGYLSNFAKRTMDVGAGAMMNGALKLPRFAAKYPVFAPHARGLNNEARGLERRIRPPGGAFGGGQPLSEFQGAGAFVSTSYGPPWTGINGTGVTATGVNLQDSPHMYGVAVDPDVIPLGAQLGISPNPFGTKAAFKAFDTGSAIQGKRVDFYDWRGRDAQYGWGTRNVKVSGAQSGGLIGAQRGMRHDLSGLRDKLNRNKLSNEDRRRLERQVALLETLVAQNQEIINENRALRRGVEENKTFHRAELRRYLAEELGSALGASSSRRALATAGSVGTF